MPRVTGQKCKLPALIRILTEQSDEEHPLSLSQIATLLEERYGIRPERKSLYDDLETLALMDYDIVTVGAGRSTKYYLGERSFELAERKLMADAIVSNRFLSEKKSAALVSKLLRDASVWQRDRFFRQIHVVNRVFSGGEKVLYTVDLLHEAICENRQISFRYARRTPSGKREYGHGGARYAVSPWALCWDDEFYYLIAYSEEHNSIRHYRVDRMDIPELLPQKRLGEKLFSQFDMTAYSRAAFGMFGGSITQVTLRCANRLADVIYDRFGTGRVLRNLGNVFEVTVPVMVSPAFLSWVLGFGADMKIMGPQGACEALLRLGKEALAQYDDQEQ